MNKTSDSSRLAVTAYIIINIALAFSLALPAAGITNHLLNVTGFSLARGLLLWGGFILAEMALTLPTIPIVRRRIESKNTKS
jgi:hypothetical protein